MNNPSPQNPHLPVAPLRAEERAALLLQKHGLVDAGEILRRGLTLAATERERATTVTVYLGDSPRFMVKLGKPDFRTFCEREILCHQALQAAGMDGRLAADLAHSDMDQCELITRLLEPSRTLHDHFATHPPHTPLLIDDLSRLLAHLHALPVAPTGPGGNLPPVMPWVFSDDWQDRDGQLAELFPSARDHRTVLSRLAEGRDIWRNTRLIHGDLKLDNWLLLDPRRGRDLRLVDWELGGLGDPAWDLATMLQELLLLPPVPTIARDAVAPMLASNAGQAAGRFVSGYLTASGIKPAHRHRFLARTGIYTGCRLIQTAFELAAVEGTEGPRAQEAIALATTLCRNPDFTRAWRMSAPTTARPGV